MNLDRVGTLIGKELREFRASPNARAAGASCCSSSAPLLPFLILVVVLPWVTGESLTSDKTLQQVVRWRAQPDLPGLAALDASGGDRVVPLAAVPAALSHRADRRRRLARRLFRRRREAGTDAGAAADDADCRRRSSSSRRCWRRSCRRSSSRRSALCRYSSRWSRVVRRRRRCCGRCSSLRTRCSCSASSDRSARWRRCRRRSPCRRASSDPRSAQQVAVLLVLPLVVHAGRPDRRRRSSSRSACCSLRVPRDDRGLDPADPAERRALRARNHPDALEIRAASLSIPNSQRPTPN